jgi:hypothetical protein
LGLAAFKQVEVLRVEWPSGLVQEFTNVIADQAYQLIEGGDLSVVEIPGIQLAQVGKHHH